MIVAVGEPERDVRVSDAERNVVVEALRAHCVDGRLTLDEFAERVEVALTAKARTDLDGALVDLPAVLPTAAPSPPRARPPVRTTIAIMGGSEQKGRWRLEGQHTAIALMGGAVIDLRHAEIIGDVVEITAVAIMGGVDVIVPEGIEVELSGLAIMGGKQSRVRGKPVLPGSPLVRVKAFAFWGGVCVKTRTSRAEKAEKLREKIDLAREIGVFPPAGPPPPPWQARREERAARHADAHERRADRAAERSGGRSRRSQARLPEGTVTVLVTDIEGSTELAEALGDLRFRQVLARHEDVVRACVDQHEGFVVKGTGDGFLLAFGSARQALLCASELQHSFDDRDELAIRMGVHTGEVVRADGDLYGKTVIVASRLAGEATGGEVLVSEITKALTESGGDLRFGETREVILKGLSGTQQAWTLDWET
jgi:class 3 adenylate cyclase